MKNFELPKMNISIFSEENIVTLSNLDNAKAQLTADTVGVSEGNITVTTFNSWVAVE